jgi:predicted DNA repair protein MutK
MKDFLERCFYGSALYAFGCAAATEWPLSHGAAAGWLIIGIIFFVIALLIVAFVPDKPRRY